MGILFYFLEQVVFALLDLLATPSPVDQTAPPSPRRFVKGSQREMTLVAKGKSNRVVLFPSTDGMLRPGHEPDETQNSFGGTRAPFPFRFRLITGLKHGAPPDDVRHAPSAWKGGRECDQH